MRRNLEGVARLWNTSRGTSALSTAFESVSHTQPGLPASALGLHSWVLSPSNAAHSSGAPYASAGIPSRESSAPSIPHMLPGASQQRSFASGTPSVDAAASPLPRQRGAGRPAGSKALRRAKVEPAKEGEEVQAIAADEDGTAVRGLATKSESGLTDVHITRLGEAEIGKFFDLPAAIIPEAFQAHYSSAAERRETVVEKGGCKGLQLEFDATESQHVMYRQVQHDLVELCTSGAPQRIIIDGPSGSGKSVALAALVAQRRSAGTLVVYIPSAFALTQDAFFSRNEDVGGWDTPDVARMLLRSVLGAHQVLLEALPSAGGGSLADVAAAGIGSNKPDVCTNAAVELLTALSQVTTVPVLIAVDDWNALYWRTSYFEWENNKKRVRINAGEVRLVAAMRQLIEGPELPRSDDGVPGCCRVICAMTHGSSIKESLRVPPPQPTPSRFKVPRMSYTEQQQWTQHYIEQGAVAADSLPDESTLRTAYYLTDGNPHELRKYGSVLCCEG